jgi:hypothetical protein
MIEFHGGDRSAVPEHGTVRMYAYLFSHHKRRPTGWGTNILPLAAQEAKQTCGSPLPHAGVRVH